MCLMVSLVALMNSHTAWGDEAKQNQTTEASQAKYPFDIASQPLPQALAAFSSITGIQVLYTEKSIYSYRSGALQGEFAANDGLHILLDGSGLQFRYTADRSVTIEKPVAGNLNDQAELDAITVVGTRQSRYDSRYAETGTLIAKNITDIPRTVDVIPEQLLLDQHASELEDVYRLSPNVVNVDGYGGSREDFLIRGFRRRDDIYRNGVRLKTNGRVNPDTVDSVQIVKGPVAEIGQMTPGGLVNIITKKPQFITENHIATDFNEYGEREVQADFTGPLNEEKTIAYRLTTSVENSRNFRKADIDRQFVSSSFYWEGDNGANVNFNYEYTHDERPIDRGVITAPGSGTQRTIVNTSVDTRFDQSDLNNRDVSTHIFELDSAIPVFNDDWTFENKLFYAYEQVDEIRNEVVNVSNTGVLTRRVQGNDDRELSTAFVRMQLRGEFDAGLPMDLVSGVELRHQDETWTNFAGANQTGGTVSNPSSFTLVDNTDSNPILRRYTEVKQLSYGPYAQGDIHLTDAVTMTLGARYEVVANEYNQVDRLTDTASGFDPDSDGHLTKSAALVWKPVEELSLYASYAETFQSQNIYSGDEATAVFAPEKGRQYEVGAKWSGWNDRLLLSGALFDIRQKNVVETVNGTPEMTGGIRSRGAETVITANPVQGLNLRAGVGLLDAEIVSENANNGNTPTNTPDITTSLWASYEFQKAESNLKGLGFGAGLYHVGNRYGDSAHSFELGDYTLLDLGMWYYLPVRNESRVRFDLGVKNVTDEQYYVASGGTYRVSVGAPRTFFGSIRFEF